jgi:hypothetical protein
MTDRPTARATIDARAIAEDAVIAEVAELGDDARRALASDLRVLGDLSALRVKAGREAGNAPTMEPRQ